MFIYILVPIMSAQYELDIFYGLRIWMRLQTWIGEINSVSSTLLAQVHLLPNI